MDHALETQAPLTLRDIRKEYVRYCNDTYPRYGEGKLEKLPYAAFKAKLLEQEALHQELTALYAAHPDLKHLSADLRTRLVGLEVRMSQLERELCMS